MKRFNVIHAQYSYMIELRHFKMLQAVAEEGGLTKAGERLFLSQSALSHQLKDLENTVGVPVFHRVGKKLLITEAGLLLLNAGRNIHRELETLQIELTKNSAEQSGRLRISTECYTCYKWLPPLIKDFNLKYPNVEVMINTDVPARPIELLQNGKVDVALVFRTQKESGIQYRELYNDEMMAVISANHPWNKKKFVVAEDFATETLITYLKNFHHSFVFEKFFKPAEVEPKKVIHLQLTETNVEMVCAGLGVTIMNSWIFRNYRNDRSLGFVRVTRKGLFRKWFVATLKKQLPDFQETFIDLIHKDFRR